MSNLYRHKIVLLLPVLWFLASCMSEEIWIERNKPAISVDEIFRDRGVVILNEGNFNYGNTSLSFYNISTGKIENDVYYRQNGVPMGDVAHSANFHNGLLYIVINNSGKVVVMNMGKYTSLKAFEYIGKITGLSSPRYVEILSDSKAYITDLYARKISVFNPQNLKIEKVIPTHDHSGEYYRHPTEQMILFDSLLFTNCYSFDDQILIINTHTDEVIDSIKVLKQPSSMVTDKNGKLWVLCDGGYEGSSFSDEFPGLARIDMKSKTLEKVYIFPQSDWPRRLCINGNRDTLYYVNGDIWRMSVNANRLPEASFIPAEGKLFYSLGIDPVTSEIYAGDAIDYVQNGVVYRFNPRGDVVDTIRVGVNPGFFLFLGSGDRRN